MYKIYNGNTNEYTQISYTNLLYAIFVANMMSVGNTHYEVRLEPVIA